MTRPFARRTFAATVDQDGLALIEYAQEASGFRALSSRFETRRFETIEGASDILVSMLAAQGGRRASLSIALQGFGCAFRRSPNDPNAGLEDGRSDASAQLPSFAASAPPTTIATLTRRLEAAGVRVDMITVVPQALSQVYRAVDGSPETTALVACLPSGPSLVLFHGGTLALAVDSPRGPDGRPNLDPAAIAEHVLRAAALLQEQIPGARTTRILLADHSATYKATAEMLESRTGMTVAPIAKSVGSPEAIAAFGAVLEAADPVPMDLRLRPQSILTRGRSAMQTPRALIATAAAIAAIAALWGGFQWTQSSIVAAQTRSASDSLQRDVAALDQLRPTLEVRASAARLRMTRSEASRARGTLVSSMAAVSAAMPAGVTIDGFAVHQVADGWQASLRLHADGVTRDAAIRSVTGLYDSIKRLPDVRNVVLGDSLAWAMHGPDKPRTSAAVPPSGKLRLATSLSFLAVLQPARR